MSSILKRISSISKIKTKILNKQAKISFNLDDSETTLKRKFGLTQSHISNIEKNEPLNAQYSNNDFSTTPSDNGIAE